MKFLVTFLYTLLFIPLLHGINKEGLPAPQNLTRKNCPILRIKKLHGWPSQKEALVDHLTTHAYADQKVPQLSKAHQQAWRTALKCMRLKGAFQFDRAINTLEKTLYTHQGPSRYFTLTAPAALYSQGLIYILQKKAELAQSRLALAHVIASQPFFAPYYTNTFRHDVIQAMRFSHGNKDPNQQST